jgi:MFS family permease
MRSDTLALLREHPAFARLWLARLAGTGAAQMLMVAVGWQMYDLTGSAWDLGLVGLLQFLPALALALPAGQLVDRWHRGRIVAGCMAVQVVVAGLLLGAGLGGWASRELLLAVAVVLGAVRAFQMPAQQALTPLLVPAIVLPRALAFSAAGMQGAIIAGPALGGLLYIAGPAATHSACMALFGLAAALLFTLRYVHVPPPAEPLSWATLTAGIHFIARHKPVLGAISLDLFAVLLGGVTALLPLYAKDILMVGPWGLGLLRTAPAVGALVVSLWLTRRPIRRRTGRVLLLAVACYGLTMLVFGISTSFALSLIALALGGAADMVSVVIRQTLVQLETPDAMRGRVSAVNAVFIGASNQLGEFRSGATAAVIGPVASVVVGGVGTLLVAGLWGRLFPALAGRDALVATPPPAPTGDTRPAAPRLERLEHPGHRATRKPLGGRPQPTGARAGARHRAAPALARRVAWPTMDGWPGRRPAPRGCRRINADRPANTAQAFRPHRPCSHPSSHRACVRLRGRERRWGCWPRSPPPG